MELPGTGREVFCPEVLCRALEMVGEIDSYLFVVQEVDDFRGLWMFVVVI